MILDLADLKLALGIQDDDSDSLLTTILENAQKRAENYCDREFDSQEKTEYYNGTGTNALLLRRYPITAIDSIYDDEDREFDADSEIDTDDIVIDDEIEGRIIYPDNTFTKSDVKNIKIKYTAGYSEAPEDLRQAILDLAIAEFIKKKGAINAVEGEEDRVKRLEDEAWDILDRYKRVR